MAGADIDLESEQIKRIAEESQCYPYFLQRWGRSLWAVMDGVARPCNVTDEQMDAASSLFARHRDSLYRGRYNSIKRDRRLAKAACEVGQAFLRNEGRPLETLDIVSVIDATLKESIRDAQVREDTAWSLHDRLNDMDYFWDPPDGPPEPGIPSIMNYIGVLHGKEPVPLSVDMDALDLGR